MTDTERQRITAICEVANINDISDLSDGYHTFRQLYYQRMMLFAALVKQNRDKAWKSLRHEDEKLCFGGGWFIVGIDTPEGSYTYHYEDKYFDLFDCEELERGKPWDGHSEKDVTRLLSLEQGSQEDKTAYKKGLTDAWEVARKMCTPVKQGGMTPQALIKIFGVPFTAEIIIKNTAAEAIAKIKAYEEEQKEIKVGDELEFYSLCAKKTIKGVVYQINYADDDVYLLWTPQDKSIGGTFTLSSDDFFIKKVKKTGRHFPQVEELLKAMKEK